MPPKHNLTLDPSHVQPFTRTTLPQSTVPISLPTPKQTKTSPASSSSSTPNASITFIGTATTILEWSGIRLLTDPNFLHKGDHVHLGPGVTGTRVTDPALSLNELPRIDAVLLSHYHADHFDQEVESQLRRSVPIITPPHAKGHLAHKGEGEDFTNVFELDHWESMVVDIEGKEQGKKAAIRVEGMPGKHVPPGPGGAVGKLNDLLAAVPPTNGWMVELGHKNGAEFECGYRIYISGDTLLVDELKEIPEKYKEQGIDLMLIHLGGTTIPSPSMPLLMVTMDAKQGIELVRLINPDVTIPIHFDDYDVFLSPLDDFKKEVEKAGLSSKVVYLDRGDRYDFHVKQ